MNREFPRKSVITHFPKSGVCVEVPAMNCEIDRRRAGMSVQRRISGELLFPCETPGRRASSYSRRREVSWPGRHLSAQPSSNCYPLVVTLSACTI
jgi:hypothetical protein